MVMAYFYCVAVHALWCDSSILCIVFNVLAFCWLLQLYMNSWVVPGRFQQINSTCTLRWVRCRHTLLWMCCFFRLRGVVLNSSLQFVLPQDLLRNPCFWFFPLDSHVGPEKQNTPFGLRRARNFSHATTANISAKIHVLKKTGFVSHYFSLC